MRYLLDTLVAGEAAATLQTLSAPSDRVALFALARVNNSIFGEIAVRAAHTCYSPYISSDTYHKMTEGATQEEALGMISGNSQTETANFFTPFSVDNCDGR